MDIKSDVVNWLKTLKKSYRDEVCIKADVSPHWMRTLLDDSRPNPGVEQVQRVYNVMQEELAKRIGQ